MRNRHPFQLAGATRRLDAVLKYAILEHRALYGKTATFMPKPIVGDNGSGMHVHQSVWKDGKNLFAATATPASANSRCTTSAASSSMPRAERDHQPRHQQLQASGSGLRGTGQAGLLGAQPLGLDPHSVRAVRQGRRIEVRFRIRWPTRYLAFAAMLMAGLDGVQNKIHPGEPSDKNLYDLSPEEDAKIPTVCSSLDQALEYLDKDREFLTRGGVFTNDMIDAYIALKMEEVTRFRMTTHPLEYDMYYSM